MIRLTIIPFPAFQSVDTITVDDDCRDFIVVYLLNRSSGLGRQALFGFTDNKIDFPSDCFSRLRMVASDLQMNELLDITRDGMNEPS